jgi:hypothetical protein
MHNRIFVLSAIGETLMPCHPARARALLRDSKAKVVKVYPFTIKLTERTTGELQPVQLKIDPGSRHSGLALVLTGEQHLKVIFGAVLHHKGHLIKQSLDGRRSLRRGRRQRKTRYRPARWANRKRADGWLPPSAMSRVNNLKVWTQKFSRLTTVSSISFEKTKFDTHLMVNPEVSGVQYQQGTLEGYTVREYLLEKHNRTCVYCGAKNVPLQIEHIHPRSRGGSNAISNLTLSCGPCNQRKGTQTLEEFLPRKPELVRKIKAQTRKSFADAAQVQAIRNKSLEVLCDFGLPVEVSTGAETKFNRTRLGYGKEHWIDAACIGSSGQLVSIHRPDSNYVLDIKAMGRGCRNVLACDKYGFPSKKKPKTRKRVLGFETGDYIKTAIKGKAFKVRMSLKVSNSRADFDGTGKALKDCRLIQKNDGYSYNHLH